MCGNSHPRELSHHLCVWSAFFIALHLTHGETANKRLSDSGFPSTTPKFSNKQQVHTETDEDAATEKFTVFS